MPLPLPSGRKRSKVWDFFDPLTDNSKRAKCSLYSVHLSFSAGNISNLNRHLNTKHPAVNYNARQPHILLSEDQSADEPSTSNNTSSASNYNISNQTKIYNFMGHSKASQSVTKVVDNQLVKMIVKEYQPLRIVEDPEFRNNICRKLDCRCIFQISSGFYALCSAQGTQIANKLLDFFSHHGIYKQIIVQQKS